MLSADSRRTSPRTGVSVAFYSWRIRLMGRKRARCFGAGYQIWSGYVTEFSDTWIRIKTNTVAVGGP
jgi:hypothetical protein